MWRPRPSIRDVLSAPNIPRICIMLRIRVLYEMWLSECELHENRLRNSYFTVVTNKLLTVIPTFLDPSGRKSTQLTSTRCHAINVFPKSSQWKSQCTEGIKSNFSSVFYNFCPNCIKFGTKDHHTVRLKICEFRENLCSEKNSSHVKAQIIF